MQFIPSAAYSGWSLVYRCWMQAHLQAPQPLHECEHFQSHPTPTAPDYDDFEWYQKWRIVQTAVSNLHYLFRTANVIFSLLLGCQFVWYFLFLSVSSISISTNTQEWISMNFSRYSEMAYTWIQDVWFFFSILLDWEGGVFIIYIPGKPVTFSWHFQDKLDKEQLVKNWE